MLNRVGGEGEGNEAAGFVRSTIVLEKSGGEGRGAEHRPVPPTFNLRISGSIYAAEKKQRISYPSMLLLIITRLNVDLWLTDFDRGFLLTTCLFRCFAKRNAVGGDSGFLLKPTWFRSYLHETGFGQCCFHSCKRNRIVRSDAFLSF